MSHRYLFILSVVLIATFSLSLLVVPPATSNESAGQKVGYIDLAVLYRDYNRVKDQRVEIQKYFEQKAGELKRKQMEIETRVKTIRDLSEEKRAGLEQEIQESLYQLDFESKWAQRSMALETNQMTWSIYLEVLQEIDGYAKANGFGLVVKVDSRELQIDTNFDAMKVIGAREVLFHNSEQDLTQKILRLLNQRHARRKK